MNGVITWKQVCVVSAVLGMVSILLSAGEIVVHSKSTLPSVAFEIRSGEDALSITTQLKNLGLVRAPLLFRTYVRYAGLERQFQAGSYLLPRTLSLQELAHALAKGAYRAPARTATMIEGWGIRELAAHLEQQGIATKEEVFAITKVTPALIQEFAFLTDLPQGATLEGYLFPDTYHLADQNIVPSLVRAMLKNFEIKVYQPFIFPITSPPPTFRDVLIMASIVEREVPLSSDRPIVAGLLWKRLKVGMPLQVDSTVNYVTGGKSRALNAQELKTDSRYNTYTHTGLPPGPIGNPGVSALQAALKPEESPYWYFLSKPDGATVFSKTLEEHIQAKKKYL